MKPKVAAIPAAMMPAPKSLPTAKMVAEFLAGVALAEEEVVVAVAVAEAEELELLVEVVAGAVKLSGSR